MTVRVGMKYREVDEHSVDPLILSEDWVFEQKFDGTRVLAVCTPGKVDFFQSGGKKLTHSAAVQRLPVVEKALFPLLGYTPGEIVLDGELMIRTGEYCLFDAPYVRVGGMEFVRPTDPYHQRRAFLELPDNLRGWAETPVTVAAQARGARAKRQLFEGCRAAGAEGIVAKRLDGEYVPGKRVDHVLKVKFVKTADVIVTAVDRPDAKHGSFTFGVAAPTADDLVGGGWVAIGDIRVNVLGKCSAIGKPEARVGDVIEVAYLYREPETGGLVQPRMMKIRPDKSPVECTIEQFPNYSRDAVSVIY